MNHLDPDYLVDLAERYGTPLYVYNGDLLLQRYRELYDYISWPKLKIYYAMKANSCPALLTLLERAGACLDTVSPGEVTLRLASETRNFEYRVEIRWCHPCDNGMFCDGAELCDVTLDCQVATPLVLDDGERVV